MSTISKTLDALDALIADVDPDDQYGIEEARVLEECAASEYRTSVAEAFGKLARRPGQLPLDAHDLAGITLVFGDLSAVD